MSNDYTAGHPSRRHFLRGVGVALALPWIESLPLFAQGAAAVKSNTPPLRLGIVYFSNGVEPIHWWAKGSGAEMELGPGLLPMMPHREDMVFIQGLYNQTAAVSTSPHLGRMNVLSGATVSLDPSEIRVGTSMDQVLSAQIGNRTAVPSLVLGIEPNELRLEDGLSMIYGSSLSWVSPTKPATKETLSLADLRSAGRRRHRARPRPQHPRRRAPGLAEPQAEDQQGRQRQAERVFRVDPRYREAHRARFEGRTHRRLAADADPTGHAPAGERATAGRSGSHEADARPDGARVPDGQDAHRHADAQQRPVADELQVPRRRAGRAAPRPDAQREGRRQGSDVPRRPTSTTSRSSPT